MKQHLAVSAIGSDRTGMVHDLTRVIADCGGNIAESRMAALGSEFAMLLLINGNWHSLARIESELARLAETGALSVHVKRTEPGGRRAPTPYPTRSTSSASISLELLPDCPASSPAVVSISTRSRPAAMPPRTPARRCSRCKWW